MLIVCLDEGGRQKRDASSKKVRTMKAKAIDMRVSRVLRTLKVASARKGGLARGALVVQLLTLFFVTRFIRR